MSLSCRNCSSHAAKIRSSLCWAKGITPPNTGESKSPKVTQKLVADYVKKIKKKSHSSPILSSIKLSNTLDLKSIAGITALRISH